MARKLTNFRIDPDLAAVLKAVKERDGIPESERSMSSSVDDVS